MSFKIGIVGAGGIGGIHAAILAKDPRVRLHSFLTSKRLAHKASEDRLFVNALEGKSPVPVTAEDGYNVVQLVEACYQSARDDARVSPSTLVSKQPADAFATQKH